MIPIAAFHGGLSILKGELNAPWGQCHKLNQVSTVGSLLTSACWCWVFVHPVRNAELEWKAWVLKLYGKFVFTLAWQSF